MPLIGTIPTKSKMPYRVQSSRSEKAVLQPGRKVAPRCSWAQTSASKSITLLETIKSTSVASYVRVGRLLHVITAAELVMFYLFYSNLPITFTEGFELGLVFRWLLLSLFTTLPILGQLDARSRFQNYKQIKDQLLLYGFDERILRPTLKSRCLRDAALVAADELGYGDRCRAHFFSCGYRWYHLVPDFVFQSPQFLLSRYFWRTTFFVSGYRPRFRRFEFPGTAEFSS